jgi:hypothetical protein
MNKEIHLDREADKRAVEVADGFWIIATHHRPGFSKMNPDLNNRCMIFRLRDGATGQPVLVVANGVDPTAMPEARRLERETGLEVRYII